MEASTEKEPPSNAKESLLQHLLGALEAEDNEFVNQLLDAQTVFTPRQLCERLYAAATESETEETRNRWYWLMLMHGSRVDLTQYRGDDEKIMRTLCKKAEEALFETA
jgi:hypothetical protein